MKTEDRYKIQTTLFRNRYIHGSSSCDELKVIHTQKDETIHIDLLDNGVMKISLYLKSRFPVLEKTIELRSLLYPEYSDLDSENSVKYLEEHKQEEVK